LLALLACGLPSCDDNLTRGPDEPFAADFAFGAYVEPQDPGGRSELYAVAGDGRVLFVTVGLRGMNLGPALSPDGKRLVFEYRDQTAAPDQDLFWVDVDRRVPVNITNSPFTEHDASWSPDGQWIAFLRERETERSLEILTEDTSARATLLSTSGSLEIGGWSPDGAAIVVARGIPGSPDEGEQLVTVSVPSGAILELTTGRAHRQAPVWSPDGTSIAYMRDGELWCLSLLRNQEERIPVALDSMSGPLSWTFDGRSIILTGSVGLRTDVCSVGIADSSLRIVTALELGGRQAAVLPDGRRIACLVFEGLRYHVYTMDLQGFNVQRVTSLIVEEFGTSARPRPFTGRLP